jgi:hypothetical protein
VARSRRHSVQGTTDTHPLRDACLEPSGTTNRKLIREQAKAQRLDAQSRLKALPLEDQRLINVKFRQDRTAGRTILPYPRWLVRLFELADAGMPTTRALSLINLHLAGKAIHGVPMQRAPSSSHPHGAGG